VPTSMRCTGPATAGAIMLGPSRSASARCTWLVWTSRVLMIASSSGANVSPNETSAGPASSAGSARSPATEG